MIRIGSLKTIFDSVVLVLLGGLVVVMLAAAVSARALPGQLTYPLKLSLENAALFVTQLHKTTEMNLRLAFLNRRYEEARTLVDAEGSVRGYRYFSEAAEATQRAVLGLREERLKVYYREELTRDLRRYTLELEFLIQELERL